MTDAATKYDKPVALRVDQAFLDAVEEIRGRQRPIPSKAEVIREAVMATLHRAREEVTQP